MGLRSAQGIRGLDGQPVGIAPPPPAPPMAPSRAVEEIIDRHTTTVLQTLQVPPAHIRYLVTLFDRETQVEIHAEGATLEEVTQDTATKYDAALPVQPLVWQDGTPLGGVSLSLLQTAVDQHEAWLTAQSAPREVWLALGRLKGALGMGDGEQQPQE